MLNNKILKIIVLVLSILSSMALAIAIRNMERLEEFHSRVDTSGYFTEFKLPEFLVTSEQETMILELLESVSNELNINYMVRVSSFGVNNNTFSETGELPINDIGGRHIFYVSNQKESNILKNFNIEKQVIDEQNYFATDLKRYPQANSLDPGLQENEEFAILPISKQEHLNSAIFFVETKDQETLDLFMSRLSELYNRRFEKEYDIAYFEAQSKKGAFVISNTLEISGVILFFLFYVLALILWLLENNRSIAIYRLNGVSTLKITHFLVLKELIGIFCLNNVVAGFLILQTMNFSFLLFQFFLIVVSLLVSYSVLVFLGFFSLNQQLNKQSFGKNFFLVTYLAKISILFFCVVQLVPLSEYVHAYFLPEVMNEQLENYAVFFPRFGGNEASITDSSQLMRGKDKEKLLAQFLNDGAIEVNTASFFEIDHGLIHQSIYVNPNYLEKYPIMSITNQPIQIDLEEERSVILIPERMMPDFIELRSWFLNEKNPYEQTKEEEDIIFYTIQDNQEIFAFDQERPITITEPNIIHVLTLNNTPIMQRDFLTGFSYGEPLKIPLDAPVEEVYSRYLPLLKEAGLEDNFPFLIPVNQLRKVENQLNFALDIEKRMIEFLVTLLLLIVLISYSTVSYSRLYRQKFVIWRLNGSSFCKTYKKIGILLLFQYALFFVYVMMHSFRITDVIPFLLFIMIESALVFRTLKSIEKKNISEFLEGK